MMKKLHWHVSYNVVLNYASTPNPVCLSMGGAIGICIDVANHARRACEDSLPPVLTMPWVPTGPDSGHPTGTVYSRDGETGVVSLIVPPTVSP